jgi:hypothetical protein
MDSLLPFLQGTCTPYNMPVYPGALRVAGNSPGTRTVGVSLRGLVNAVAVGTIIADRPPAQTVRALISAYGSYLGYVAAKRSSCFPHTRQTV